MNEFSYLKTLHTIFEHGKERDTRSGPVLSLFGHTIEFNLQDGFRKS